jgi:peptidoglycan/LPS O-acetylase OafA/YrhL
MPLCIASFLVFVLVSPFRIMQTGRFHLLTAAVLFPLAVYVGARATLPASLTTTCVVLGEASYPLYLLQPIFLHPLGSTYMQAFFFRHDPLKNAVLAGMILCMLLLSYAVARFLDEPLRKYLSMRYRTSFNQPAKPYAKA